MIRIRRKHSETAHTAITAHPYACSDYKVRMSFGLA